MDTKQLKKNIRKEIINSEIFNKFLTNLTKDGSTFYINSQLTELVNTIVKHVDLDKLYPKEYSLNVKSGCWEEI